LAAGPKSPSGTCDNWFGEKPHPSISGTYTSRPPCSHRRGARRRNSTQDESKPCSITTAGEDDDGAEEEGKKEGKEVEGKNLAKGFSFVDDDDDDDDDDVALDEGVFLEAVNLT